MTQENYYEKIDQQGERPKLDFLSDISLMDSLSEEVSDNILPRVKYYRLKWETSRPDNLYNEQDKKTFLDPIYIPVNAEINPPEKTLAKYGILHKRDIIFVVAMAILKRYNILPKMGDQIEYDNSKFRVLDIVKDKFWAGSLQATEVKLACDYMPFKEDADRYG